MLSFGFQFLLSENGIYFRDSGGKKYKSTLQWKWEVNVIKLVWNRTSRDGFFYTLFHCSTKRCFLGKMLHQPASGFFKPEAAYATARNSRKPRNAGRRRKFHV
jgi:hypothetical protein